MSNQSDREEQGESGARPARPPNFFEQVARSKVPNAAAEWEFCSWERVGEDGQIVQGGVPSLVTRGKTKGRKRWDRKTLDRVVVTDAEVYAARAQYERSTGKCCECGGSGQEWAGWSVAEGTKYRPCRRCNATGAASLPTQEPQS